ncbi:hypothetical protein L2725_20095 [Shewanella corallii]|uniref:Uncharacterized protein n=1 Tax=Shewanella corallii TaxID=560080 RepID=A0ABT0NC41_9GAMM|nr:hypothetical protein [Shewanella corallii]MCL2916046.1 hypothetical protein [Shewanella corallii]
MSDDIQLIVQAINKAAETDVIKDYIYPMLSGITFTLLAAGTAYFTVKHQERKQQHIAANLAKLKASNKLILSAQSALLNVITIKQAYILDLPSDPILRMLNIGQVECNYPLLDLPLEDFSFLSPSIDEIDHASWENLAKIAVLMKNYNATLGAWSKRNRFEDEVKMAILSVHGQKVIEPEISIETIIDAASAFKVGIAVDLNERSIELTDVIINDLHSFLTEFPKAVRPHIDVNAIKGYGKIIQYGNMAESFNEIMLAKTPSADWEEYTKFMKGKSTGK